MHRDAWLSIPMKNKSKSNQSDCWIVKKSTLECQEPWGPLDGTKEMAEYNFDATTNLEGGN
jgi:hypothetical protein